MPRGRMLVLAVACAAWASACATAPRPAARALVARPPAPVRWRELGAPDPIARGRGGASLAPERFVFPLYGTGATPYGALTVTDRIAAWSPSHVAPIATRALADLAGPSSWGVRPLASTRGLFLVETARELVALDPATLATRWRYVFHADDRPVELGDCVVRGDLVLLRVRRWWAAGPVPTHYVGLDRAGHERFDVASYASFPEPADVQPQRSADASLDYDRDTGELVGRDRATHAETWYTALAGPERSRAFVLANDGAVAVYAESRAADDDTTPIVLAFRPGAAPPVRLVHVTGTARFAGQPIAAVVVRARGALAVTNAAGEFTLDVPARAPFQLAARGPGIARCAALVGSADVDLTPLGSPPPVELALVDPCDDSDE